MVENADTITGAGKKTALELTNISKTYGKNPVLQRIDLEVADGEFMVLLGPSGCGKTTLLRIIAGLTPLDSGSVVLNSREITPIPVHQRDIGLVFQNYALFPHMSVAKNVAFGLRMRGLPKAEIETKVNEALHIVQLDGLQKRQINELSGGQQQRVALARALVLHPSLLLLDEPLSNLDAILRGVMRVEIAQIQKQLGLTAILVTHDQVEAMTMGDTIVLLKDGVIQQKGSPIEIYEKPVNTFVAGFIGSPSINFFSLNISGDGFYSADLQLKLPDGLIRNCLALTGKDNRLKPGKYILGIRPENICIADGGSDPSDSSIKCTVTFVELLGSDTLMHLRAGEKGIVMRIAGNVATIKKGDEISITFGNSKGHLFDAETHKRVMID